MGVPPPSSDAALNTQIVRICAPGLVIVEESPVAQNGSVRVLSDLLHHSALRDVVCRRRRVGRKPVQT
jgi:hypothetical protein